MCSCDVIRYNILSDIRSHMTVSMVNIELETIVLLHITIHCDEATVHCLIVGRHKLPSTFNSCHSDEMMAYEAK